MKILKIILKQTKNEVKRKEKKHKGIGRKRENVRAYTSKKIKHLPKQKYSLRMLSIKVRTKPLEPI